MSFNPQFQKVGDILVYEKVITKKQLSDALEEQKKTKEKLGQILISKGIITENDLTKAYSQQMGHKHVLENDLLVLPEDIVGIITEDFAREHHVIAMENTDFSNEKPTFSKEKSGGFNLLGLQLSTEEAVKELESKPNVLNPMPPNHLPTQPPTNHLSIPSPLHHPYRIRGGELFLTGHLA